MEIHDTSAAAVHVQSRDADTETVPDPPPAGNVAADPAITAHLSAVGAKIDDVVDDDVQAVGATSRKAAKANRIRGTIDDSSNRFAGSLS